MALAHRGGWIDPADVVRENTLYAFDRAVQLGYRYLETDVHATSDGVLVAFHDMVTDRVAGAGGPIGALRFDQVRRLRVGGRDQIPTLAEVLEALPGTRINIDIKSAAAIGPLVDTLARQDAWSRVCVASFSAARLRTFRRLAGAPVTTAVSPPGVVRTRFLPGPPGLPRLPGLPGLLGTSGEAFQVPAEQIIAGRRLTVVTRGFVRRAHAAGKQVHVWTVNDPARMEALIDLGVDGLISDDIVTLRRVLQRRGLWV